MMNQDLFESMSFKDLYQLQKPLKDKYGNLVTGDTPISDIPEIEFDDYGKIMYVGETSTLTEKERELEWYNGYEESEIFGCKDNNYLEDEEFGYYD